MREETIIIAKLLIILKNTMGKYVYSLHDYHSIKQADIAIDGITVLSGVNGCGKSTLSKWLYYIVNGTNNFERYIYADFIKEIRGAVDELNLYRRDIDRRMWRQRNENILYFRTIDSILRKLINGDGGQNDMEEAVTLFNKALSRFCEILKIYLNGPTSPDTKERILRHLNIPEPNEGGIDNAIGQFFSVQMQRMEKLEDDVTKKQDARLFKNFFDLIKRTFNITEPQPVDMNLEEDGVKLFSKNSVGNIYGLSRAIYVDTPMAVSESVASDDSNHWNDLHKMMLNILRNFEPTAAHKKILLRIGKLLNGEVMLKINDFNQKRLFYTRKDGLTIRLEDTATGFKSFSYIMRLLENGYIDDKTLLMIDEPEAHLHPQWIVEFAHILVLLNKELGTKVMVASHNPDMVMAIQAIAKKENVLDNTHFYMAKEAENRFTYEYEDLGQDVEGVFRSFNVAYQKIEQYGSADI